MSLFMIKKRPLKFHLTGLKENERAEVSKLIVENGGQVSNGGDTTCYFTNLEGCVPGKAMVHVNYIRDCVKGKQLLQICTYRPGEETGCMLSILLLDAPSSPITLTTRSSDSLTNGAVPASTEPLVFEGVYPQAASTQVESGNQGAGDISPTDKSQPAISADGKQVEMFRTLFNMRAAKRAPKSRPHSEDEVSGNSASETPMKRRKCSKTARNNEGQHEDVSKCISSGNSSEDEAWISTSNRHKIKSDDPKPGTSKEPDIGHRQNPKDSEVISLSDSSSPTPRLRNRKQTKVDSSSDDGEEPAQDRSRDTYVISDSDSPRPGCSNEERRRSPGKHSDNSQRTSTQPGSLKKKSVTLRSLMRDHTKFGIRPETPYNEWEQLVMIRYLYENDHLIHSYPKGLMVWREMFDAGYLTHRKPLSLHNHFRKFNIDEELKELFKSLRDKIL